MKNDFEQGYRAMVEDNVNVGKTNDGVEFLILIAGIVALCFLVYLFADNISNFFIDRMSIDAQLKIVKTISFSTKPTTTNKDKAELEKLENIRDKIVSHDKNLQNKSEFKIQEVPQKEINAFVIPDGSIFVTAGLLDKIKDEEILTFVIAHELGHYAHRDHLKMISRQIIVASLMSVISTGNKQVASGTINSISSLNELKHSRTQERNADKYANAMLYRIYGNNNGAIKFFQYLDKEKQSPEFMQYFSTHPSTKQRLKLIQEQ